MKIRLINTAKLFRETFPPLGLALLNGYLKQNNAESEIFDLDIVVKHGNSKKNNEPIDIKYIKNKLYELPSYLTEEKKDEYLDEQVYKIINLMNIKDNELLGFQVVKHELVFVLYIAKKIRENFNNKIILGGRPISRLTDETLENYIRNFNIDYIEYFVKGDAYFFFQLILKNEISVDTKKTLIFKEKHAGDRYRTTDNIYPQYNRQHLELYKISPQKLGYFFRNIRPEVKEKLSQIEGGKRPLVVPTLFQQGCFQNCAYCGFDKRVFKKSVDETLETLDFLNKKYRVKDFYFLNTNLAFDKNFVSRLTERLKEYDIKWGDTSNLSSLTPEVIKKFSNSGCIELYSGTVTGSEKLHHYINRRPGENPFEHYKKIYKTIDKNGIWLVTDIMSGLPYETDQDIKDSIRFLQQNKDYINGIYHARFFLMPDSPFGKYPEKYGLKIYNPNIGTDSVKNFRDAEIVNYNCYSFSEKTGLAREKKEEQMKKSGDYFDKAIDKLFPRRVNLWYPIFLMYNNFESKKDILQFLNSR